MATDTRERIVTAGAELFRRQGYTGTGVKQIVAEAQAPFGSLYHFFPGGKEQLGAEVIRSSGGLYGLLLPAIFDPAPDLVSGVRAFFTLAGEHLEESGYADACPIATVALEVASTSEPLREATAEVFESWIDAAMGRFAADGIADDAARDLAITMFCALEGAFILARALRSTQPLNVAGEAMADRMQAALA